VDGDGCSGCALSTCGNGQVDQGETCDDGDVQSPNCLNCSVAYRPLSSGRPVRSSSQSGDHGPERAIDGDFNSIFLSRPGIGEWLEVDLEAVRLINAIHIWSRPPCGGPCYVQASNLDVQTSDDGQVWTNRLRIEGDVDRPSIYGINNVWARYVRLWKRSNEWLGLAELQVWGF
jgi:hypothetical protein